LILNAQPVQAGAGAMAAGETSSCLDCHENLYYNYDTGKHYCLTEASTRCMDCHEGDPEAIQEQAAHVGLVAYPIVNGDISRCESCHPQDAQAHVDTFAARAGYSPTVHIARQAQPSATLETTPIDEGTAATMLDKNTVLGISVILTVIAGLLVFCILTHKSCQ
ncbi:MAG: hypothetical protein AB1531_09830, partial [Chloroflexota bacterium]